MPCATGSWLINWATSPWKTKIALRIRLSCGRPLECFLECFSIRSWVKAADLFQNLSACKWTVLGPIRTRSFSVFVLWIGRPLLVVFVSQGRNLIITIASAHIALDWRCLIVTRHFYWKMRSWSKHDNRTCFAREKKNIICVAKPRFMNDVSTLSEDGLPQRPPVGTFDVCLARPKVCPTDIVRPHAARLMVDRTVDHFCLSWPSAD